MGSFADSNKAKRSGTGNTKGKNSKKKKVEDSPESEEEEKKKEESPGLSPEQVKQRARLAIQNRMRNSGKKVKRATQLI
jgi:hypothetical protein